MRFQKQQTKTAQHLSSQKQQRILTAFQLSFALIVVTKLDPANVRFGKPREPQALLLRSSKQWKLIIHVLLLLMSTVAWDITTLLNLCWMKLDEFGPLASNLA